MSEDKMVDSDLYQCMRGLDFLRGVPDQYVRELAVLGRLVEYSEGALIFQNQDPALYCYLIVEGSVSLEICGPGVGCTRLLTIGAGDLLGCSPVLGQSELTATARALTTPTRMVELNGSEVVKSCEKNPEFGYQFMRCTALAMAKRLTATRLQLLDMYRADSPP
jgi:CRP-like cAMP-binding protein